MDLITMRMVVPHVDRSARCL